MRVLNKFGQIYEIKIVKFQDPVKPLLRNITEKHQKVIDKLSNDLSLLAVSTNRKIQTGKVVKLRDLERRRLEGAKPNLENRGVAECYRNTSQFKYDSPKKVLVVGTSITDQSLNVEEIILLQELELEKIKCFTIRKEDGTINPARNLEEMLPKKVKEKKYNIIVVELGCNEVTNAGNPENPELWKEKAREKVKVMTECLRKVNRNVKLIILKTINRLDGKGKMGEIMNEVFEEEFGEQEGDWVFVRELEIECRSKWDQV